MQSLMRHLNWAHMGWEGRPGRDSPRSRAHTTRMTVFPRERRANASGASFSGAHGRDPRVEPPVPHPLDKDRELPAIGFDDEEDRPAVGGLDRGRRGDGDEGAAGPHQRGGAVEDLGADHVEHQVRFSGLGELAELQVDEGVGPETEDGVPGQRPVRCRSPGRRPRGPVARRSTPPRPRRRGSGRSGRPRGGRGRTWPARPRARKSAARRRRCGPRRPVAERGCAPPPRRTRPGSRPGPSRPARTPAGRP